MHKGTTSRHRLLLGRRSKGTTFPYYKVDNKSAMLTPAMEQDSDKVDDQRKDGKPQPTHLGQKWQRFFPGRNYGDVVQDFAYYIRANEQHEFDKHDSLLRSLDRIYFRTTEPVRFLDLLHEAWQLLQQIVADLDKGPALFEELDSVRSWIDVNGKEKPINGYPINNASRARAALCRMEQWLKTRRQAPSDQLITLIQSIPVVVWHDLQPGSYAKTTVSLPMDEHEDFMQTIKVLWKETEQEISTKKLHIAKAIRERIVKSLYQITKVERADIDALEQRQQAETTLQSVEWLPRYYPFIKWGDLELYVHTLPRAQLSRFFWPALEFSMERRRQWAVMICEELSLKQSSPVQKNTTSIRNEFGNNETPRKERKSPSSSDPWNGVLRNYTVEELDKLLVIAGLLDSVTPLKVKANTTPREWVAVAHALKLAKKTKADRATLHRAFVERYSEDEDTPVVKLRAFSERYNDTNEDSVLCLSRMVPILGIDMDEKNRS